MSQGPVKPDSWAHHNRVKFEGNPAWPYRSRQIDPIPLTPYHFWMVTRALGLVLLAFLLFPPSVFSQGKSGAEFTKDKIEAKARYEQGTVHFNLDEWAQAIEEFKAAYRLFPDPNFLYNIAQCYRKLGNRTDALSYYKKYLREKPDTTIRLEIEKRIEELESPPSTNSVAPPVNAPLSPTVPEDTAQGSPTAIPTTPVVTPSLGLSATPGESSPTAQLTTETLPPAPVKTPGIFHRWWFWTAAGAVVVTGITVAILASSSSSTAEPFRGTLNPPIITVPR